MFFNLIVFIGLIAAPAPPQPPRIFPPARVPVTGRVGSPYQCMVAIEFVNGAPVLELVCGN